MPFVMSSVCALTTHGNRSANTRTHLLAEPNEGFIKIKSYRKVTPLQFTRKGDQADNAVETTERIKANYGTNVRLTATNARSRATSTMKIKRRQFLAQSALGLGATMLGAPLLARTETAPKFFDPYERVPLGKKKLNPSRFCLGTGM